MYIADLHIHSRFSRATSRDGDLPHLENAARRKGLSLLGTGDFTHPKWREEMRNMLVPDADGLYRLKDELCLPCSVPNALPPRFVVSGEISTIYKRDGKTRKVHHVILLPSIDDADTLSHRLEAIGNLHSDGRPILGLDSEELLKITLDTCPNAIFIPAHIWTPHFSVLGAFSDFSGIEECYGDLSQNITALETGLSSDPSMNRRLSILDRYALVSNSDAHSPGKLGREATLFDGNMDYFSMKKALETKKNLLGTLEFFPEEGKYHLDGHRTCHCCLTPKETLANGGRCPVCGKKVTVGVLHRVEALADRPEGFVLPNDQIFESLIPLQEIVAECLNVSAVSKKAAAEYENLLNTLGTELHILRELSLSDAESAVSWPLHEALRRLRAGKVQKHGGYDGEYGVISLFSKDELRTQAGQTSFSLPDMVLPKTEAVSSSIPDEIKTEDAPVAPAAALNERQAEAVHSDTPHIAVIAGPGTGKTKTLVSRIVRLLQDGIPARDIGAVTFTRQAAKELSERAAQALGGKKAVRGLHVGTFHALCLELTDKKRIVSPQQAKEILTALLKENHDTLSPAQALRYVSALQNGLPCSDAPAWLLPAYQEALTAMNARDLDGLLIEGLTVRTPFKHLFVDEFQDISPLQRRLIKAWAKEAESVFVIGDPDQSIYGFRGADAGCFEAFCADFADTRIIRLTDNYRSTPQILSAACAAISVNAGAPRTLLPHCADGVRVRYVDAHDALDEGIFISKEIARLTGGLDMAQAQHMETGRARAFSEIAVLCRTHRQLEMLESCFKHDGIPCLVFGRGNALEDAKVCALLALFEALLDPQNEHALDEALSVLYGYTPVLRQRAFQTLQSGKMSASEGTMKDEAAVVQDGHADVPEAALSGDSSALHQQTLQNDGVDTSKAALNGDALAVHQQNDKMEVPEAALKPFFELANTLLPRIKKDKPRRLLDKAVSALSLRGAAIRQLLNMAAFSDTMPAFLDALQSGEDIDLCRFGGSETHAGGAVRLMTLHAAKGLEFPVVFLAGLQKDTLPSTREGADVSEERRLLFVGMTRAKEQLILTCGGEPSPFLHNLPASVSRSALPARAPKAEQLSLF